MLPPRVAKVFRETPRELIELCRLRPWSQLTSAPAPGMRSVRDILVHLMENESGWIVEIVQGEANRQSRIRAFQDLNSILNAWTDQRQRTAEFLSRLTDEEVRSTRSLPWSKAETATVAEIIWHVIAHEQYHRGQIFTRLALLGQRELPDLDLIRAPG